MVEEKITETTAAVPDDDTNEAGMMDQDREDTEMKTEVSESTGKICCLNIASVKFGLFFF